MLSNYSGGPLQQIGISTAPWRGTFTVITHWPISTGLPAEAGAANTASAETTETAKAARTRTGFDCMRGNLPTSRPAGGGQDFLEGCDKILSRRVDPRGELGELGPQWLRNAHGPGKR